MPSPIPVTVTTAEMRALETAAIAAGAPETELMEEAGTGLAAVVRQFFPLPGTAVLFTGKGHNAGDAFVLARHLLEAGWQVECRAAWPEEAWRPLTQEKWAAVRDRIRPAALDAPAPDAAPLLLVDGLLGIGAGGALQPPVRGACQALHALRQSVPAQTLAIDIPSGLDCDSGAADPDTVRADLTVTLGFPKQGLTKQGAADFTGRLAWVPLRDIPAPDNIETRERWITPETLRPLLKERPFSMHKGQAGRVGIVAGSRGLTGAARLAATAAATAGGGLVTLFCPLDVYEILAAACPPEIMVRPVNSCLEVMDFPLDAIGVGPGMGTAPVPYLAALLQNDPRPVVVDADALNAMAAHRVSLAGRNGGPRLLTPHPGELARLTAAFTPQAPGCAATLAAQQQVTVLSKSARSTVVEAGRPAACNTTGHPCMARGGMGDVLTGMMTTFAAQGMALAEAAALGSWLIGHAAEIAQRSGSGAPEDFSASQLIAHLGHALASLRRPGTR